MAKESDQFVSALARGLSVFRAFGEGAEELTLSEVAARTGLTRAGARRILLTLQGLSYAETNGRKFRLTPRVLELGYAYLSSMPFWRFAQSIVEQLVSRVGETASLAVLDIPDIVHVVRIQIHRILSGGASIGTRLPAHATSMGRVMLAALPEQELDHYLEEAKLQPVTQDTVTDKEMLRSILNDVRQQGYCYVAGEMEEHISGISVPVRDASGKVVAALNISANTSRVTRDIMINGLLPDLITARNQMEEQLRLRR